VYLLVESLVLGRTTTLGLLVLILEIVEEDVSLTQNLLFGINVGADNLPISGNTTLNEVGSQYHSRAHIVPSAFLD
jgi:hypothetical protein